MIEINVQLKISDKDIKEAINTLNAWYGIEINESILKIMCEKDLSWAKDWVEAGMDTIVRENMATVFCRWYLQIMPYRWPLGGDKSAYKEMFYEALVRGCKDKGVKCAPIEEYLPQPKEV